jgi:hypothetical protein
MSLGCTCMRCFVGVGQGYRDEPFLEGPEGASVDACEAYEEVCAAFPGETPYPISDTTTATPIRTEPVVDRGALEGECR